VKNILKILLSANPTIEDIEKFGKEFLNISKLISVEKITH
jgi:hypothetical protein